MSQLTDHLTDHLPSLPAVSREGLVSRLFSAKGGSLLLRNSIVSCFVFAVGLALLWLLVDVLAVPILPAVALSFVAANSLHYAIGRWWIFKDSSRGVGTGYVLFFINAGIGLVVTLALFAAFTDYFGMNYLAARVLVSLFSGLGVFLLNAVVNFRSI